MNIVIPTADFPPIEGGISTVALSGAVLTLTRSPDGSITDLSGMDAVVEKLLETMGDSPAAAAPPVRVDAPMLPGTDCSSVFFFKFRCLFLLGGAVASDNSVDGRFDLL